MRRVEVFTDGKILSPLRDPARQIAIHLVDGAEEIAHRRESSRRHNFVEIRDLEDAESGRARDREGLGRLAVDELGAQLERHRDSGVMSRENATADARAGFNHGDSQTSL